MQDLPLRETRKLKLGTDFAALLILEGLSHLYYGIKTRH